MNTSSAVVGYTWIHVLYIDMSCRFAACGVIFSNFIAVRVIYYLLGLIDVCVWGGHNMKGSRRDHLLMLMPSRQ